MNAEHRADVERPRVRRQRVRGSVRGLFPPRVNFSSTAGGLVMFKRCRGAAKALSAAYQITRLMAGLSGLLISVEKRKDKSGVGGGHLILFLVTAKSSSCLLFRPPLPVLSFRAPLLPVLKLTFKWW